MYDKFKECVHFECKYAIKDPDNSYLDGSSKLLCSRHKFVPEYRPKSTLAQIAGYILLFMMSVLAIFGAFCLKVLHELLVETD